MKITPNGYKRLIDTNGVSETDNFSVSSTMSQDSQLTRSSVIDRIQFQPPFSQDNAENVNSSATQEKLNSSRIRFMR